APRSKRCRVARNERSGAVQGALKARSPHERNERQYPGNSGQTAARTPQLPGNCAGQAGRQRPHSEPTPLASSAAPASPDFSGWNWVAHSAPHSTAAANAPPWTAVATSAPSTTGGAAYECTK